MNYYKRHLGDYIRDTAHLSLLEHGVYARLLDVYYARESGIPDDMAERVIGARSPDERAAVRAILAEFFRLDDGVWVQDRCESEIGHAKAKAERNRITGTLGGRPATKTKTVRKRNPNKTQTVTNGNPNVTLANSHKPIAISQDKTPPPSAAVCAREPEGLDREAAERFIEYRRKRKPAIRPESMDAFKRQLARFGDRQADVVEHSIANGYQGLVEPRGTAAKPAEPVRTWRPEPGDDETAEPQRARL